MNSTPAIRGGVVYAGTSDGYRFFGLDAKTGRLKLTLDGKGTVFSSPALAGEMAYVGASNGRLLAVDVKSGKLMWDFQIEGSKQDPMKMLKPDGGLNNEAAVLFAAATEPKERKLYDASHKMELKDIVRDRDAWLVKQLKLGSSSSEK